MSKFPPTYGHTARPVSKIGPVSQDRTKAQPPQPADTVASAEHRTFVDTYFTALPVTGAETPIIYGGDRLWVKVTLTLETAGPVAVGNQSALAPVLSGKGQLLETDTPMTFYIAKGTRLYVLSTSINRIKRVIEPVPWLETITGLIGAVVALLRGGGGSVVPVKSKI